MSSAAYIAPNTTSDCTGDSLYRKIAWRLMPILVIGYIIAYIDRVNVSFAKLPAYFSSATSPSRFRAT